MLGISRALAYQLVRGGELPSIKLGRRSVASRENDPIRSAAIPT